MYRTHLRKQTSIYLSDLAIVYRIRFLMKDEAEIIFHPDKYTVDTIPDITKHNFQNCLLIWKVNLNLLQKLGRKKLLVPELHLSKTTTKSYNSKPKPDAHILYRYYTRNFVTTLHSFSIHTFSHRIH